MIHTYFILIDEYFMSHMQAIDDLCVKQRERFVAKTKWESNFLKCIETYPLIQIHAEDDAGDLRCRVCIGSFNLVSLLIISLFSLATIIGAPRFCILEENPTTRKRLNF